MPFEFVWSDVTNPVIYALLLTHLVPCDFKLWELFLHVVELNTLVHLRYPSVPRSKHASVSPFMHLSIAIDN